MREPPPLAPPDGRQSETASGIARGVRRLLRARGFSTVTELALLDGRRADVVALNGEGALLIVEIKSSVADFRADHKWRDYAAHCDRLYFAISAEIPVEIMPEDAGLIVADPYGAEILREASSRLIAPATRRAVLLRFAQAAADRLHRLADPGGVAEF
ncbi:MAG: MmcB family DNA repair protein [Roseiarcus sp.]